jgi:hypothetical protein
MEELYLEFERLSMLFLLGHLPGKQPPGGGCHERAAIIPTDRLYAIPPNFKRKGWI